MIDASFLDTASKKKKDKFRQPKEWLVPANPKYYDIEHAIDEDGTALATVWQNRWKEAPGSFVNLAPIKIASILEVEAWCLRLP